MVDVHATEGAQTVSQEVVRRLRDEVRGPVLARGDPGYDEARAVYNGMIDRYPGAIARGADVADVMRLVAVARDLGLPLAVRGGGHHGGGFGTIDGGLLLDLSSMSGVRVDPEARTARVGGGATWGQVDHATHGFGLATPSGIFSTTGVGGLTLGGGHGYLSRKYGLTIDNLLAADVVLADGTFVTTDAEREPDLFWALRGGGGNFGVVTSFLFRLHPVATVFGGPMLWPLDGAATLLAWYRDFIRDADEDVYGWFGFLVVPPAPAFPAELHGRTMAGIMWCHTGSPAEAEATMAAVQREHPPSFAGVGPLPYPALQSSFDALYPPGQQWYWRADFVRELPDEAIEQHLAFAATLPTPQSTMHLYPINGAVHRVGRQDTAFGYRDATWSSVTVGVDPDPGKADALRRWCREYWEALHPFAMQGGYVNFMMEEGGERVRASYRDNYARLVRVKRRYDPDNLFRFNQNVPPGDD